MERQQCNPLQNFDDSKSEILKKRLLKSSSAPACNNLAPTGSQHNVLLNTLRTPISSSMIVSSVGSGQGSLPLQHGLMTHSLAPVKLHPNPAPYPLQLSTVHVPVQIPGTSANINVPVQLSGPSSSVPLQIAPVSLPIQVSGTTSVPVQLPAGDTINVPLQIPGASQNIQLGPPGMQSMPILQSSNQPMSSIIHVHMGSNPRSNSMDNGADMTVTSSSHLQTVTSGAQVQMGNNSTVVQIPSSVNNSIQLALPNSVSSGTVQLRGATRNVPHVVYIQTPQGLKPVTSTDVISQASTSGNPPQIIVRRPVTSNSNIHLISNVNNKPNIAPKISLGKTVSAPAATPPIVIQKPKSNEKMIVPVSIAPGNAGKQAIAYLSSVKKPNTKNMADNQSILISNNQTTVNSNNQKLFLTPMTMPKIQNTKFILPVTLPATMASKGPIINLQIANGQIQNDPQGNITVMRDSAGLESADMPPLQPLAKMGNLNGNSKETNPIPQSPNKCETYTISIPGSRAEPTDEQGTYTLSIPETNASMNDDIYTVSIADDEDQSREKSFTLAIPEKGKSLLNRNMIERNEVGSHVTIAAPAILRRSNSDNSERKASHANLKRRISLCNENLASKNMKFTQPLPKTAEKSEERQDSDNNDDHRVPSLFCDEKLDKDLECKVILGDSDEEYKEKKEPETKSLLYYQKDMKNERMKRESVDSALEEDPPGLFWNNGIAQLQGSTLQFQTNEFGLIDFIDASDPEELPLPPSAKYHTPLKQRIERPREKKPTSPEDLYRCDGCGCHGMAAEFITPNFCSLTCQSDVQKVTQKKRDRERAELTRRRNKMKKLLMRKQHDEPMDEPAKPDDEKLSDDVIDEKYPWMCGKNGFSWMRYLDFCKAKAAPVKLFKDPFPYNRNGFKVGMRMEAIDPQRASVWAVVSVAEVQGYRLRLHFDSYPDIHDYWVNADCPDVFPAGWCERSQRALRPPAAHRHGFSWPMYLKQMRAIAAPRHLFPHITTTTVKPNGFRIGMKLEAEDRKNDMVCVATVADMLDARLLINFDSWDDMYDVWLDPTSPYIHSVGWAEENGIALTPPNFYKDPDSFSWESYLAETGAAAAPPRAFKTRPPQGFKPGMKLEVVDKRVPFLIRVASISEVKGHQVRISFDGWPDELSYWLDDDSPDIHPVGWCLKTGHPLEPPLTAEEAVVLGPCGVGGCRGLGSLRGGAHKQHVAASACPYRAPASPAPPDRLAAERPTSTWRPPPARTARPPRRPRPTASLLNDPRGKKQWSWARAAWAGAAAWVPCAAARTSSTWRPPPARTARPPRRPRPTASLLNDPRGKKQWSWARAAWAGAAAWVPCAAARTSSTWRPPPARTARPPRRPRPTASLLNDPRGKKQWSWARAAWAGAAAWVPCAAARTSSTWRPPPARTARPPRRPRPTASLLNDPRGKKQWSWARAAWAGAAAWVPCAAARTSSTWRPPPARTARPPRRPRPTASLLNDPRGKKQWSWARAAWAGAAAWVPCAAARTSSTWRPPPARTARPPRRPRPTASLLNDPRGKKQWSWARAAWAGAAAWVPCAAARTSSTWRPPPARTARPPRRPRPTASLLNDPRGKKQWSWARAAWAGAAAWVPCAAARTSSTWRPPPARTARPPRRPRPTASLLNDPRGKKQWSWARAAWAGAAAWVPCAAARTSSTWRPPPARTARPPRRPRPTASLLNDPRGKKQWSWARAAWAGAAAWVPCAAARTSSTWRPPPARTARPPRRPRPTASLLNDPRGKKQWSWARAAWAGAAAWVPCAAARTSSTWRPPPARTARPPRRPRPTASLLNDPRGKKQWSWARAAWAGAAAWVPCAAARTSSTWRPPPARTARPPRRPRPTASLLNDPRGKKQWSWARAAWAGAAAWVPCAAARTSSTWRPPPARTARPPRRPRPTASLLNDPRGKKQWSWARAAWAGAAAWVPCAAARTSSTWRPPPARTARPPRRPRPTASLLNDPRGKKQWSWARAAWAGAAAWVPCAAARTSSTWRPPPARTARPPRRPRPTASLLNDPRGKKQWSWARAAWAGAAAWVPCAAARTSSTWRPPPARTARPPRRPRPTASLLNDPRGKKQWSWARAAWAGAAAWVPCAAARTSSTWRPPPAQAVVLGPCGVGGCRGLGSLRGGAHKQHVAASACPYRAPASPAPPDRLAAERPTRAPGRPPKTAETLTPTSDTHTSKEKPTRGRPPKHKRVEEVSKADPASDGIIVEQQRRQQPALARAPPRAARAALRRARAHRRTAAAEPTRYMDAGMCCRRVRRREPRELRSDVHAHIAALQLPSRPDIWTQVCAAGACAAASRASCAPTCTRTSPHCSCRADPIYGRRYVLPARAPPRAARAALRRARAHRRTAAAEPTRYMDAGMCCRRVRRREPRELRSDVHAHIAALQLPSRPDIWTQVCAAGACAAASRASCAPTCTRTSPHCSCRADPIYGRRYVLPARAPPRAARAALRRARAHRRTAAAEPTRYMDAGMCCRRVRRREPRELRSDVHAHIAALQLPSRPDIWTQVCAAGACAAASRASCAPTCTRTSPHCSCRADPIYGRRYVLPARAPPRAARAALRRARAHRRTAAAEPTRYMDAGMCCRRVRRREPRELRSDVHAHIAALQLPSRPDIWTQVCAAGACAAASRASCAPTCTRTSPHCSCRADPIYGRRYVLPARAPPRAARAALRRARAHRRTAAAEPTRYMDAGMCCRRVRRREPRELRSDVHAHIAALQLPSRPDIWTQEQVGTLVARVGGAAAGAAARAARLAGRELLMASQEELVACLHIRLGPAVKVYGAVRQLRRAIT
ncbi:LOW QUALITY PROTEIN: uncharacterized protein LOC134742344 [Cydia strobilella]|uniref:LOW QUALITY PROTEIN: uncharacterized protein LOC134742344 n=1 Tax=Cydia strobilella TaxID=1100964 RepID=UPI003006D1E9